MIVVVVINKNEQEQERAGYVKDVEEIVAEQSRNKGKINQKEINLFIFSLVDNKKDS